MSFKPEEIKGVDAGSERPERQRERFIGRAPEVGRVIDQLSKQNLSPEEFFRIISEFNGGRLLPERYKKDYMDLPDGRKLSMYWDDKGNVRLGGKFSSQEQERV